jgi:hypothetical protein
MEQLHYKPIEGTPFRLEISSVQNRPGTWNSTKISIYRDDDYDVKTNVYRRGILIGEYLRNYHGHGFETFYPFQIGEDWYALYSADYTATRVMKLHADRIEDWCGEESHSNGFCPVEFYVPRYISSKHTMNLQGKDETYDINYVDCDYEVDDFRAEILNANFRKLEYCNFGFLCGCVWGDDTSWKLRYIDLSQIPDKILSITDKFGYWELPEGPLRSHIRMDGWESGHDWVCLTKQEYINLKTGERS